VGVLAVALLLLGHGHERGHPRMGPFVVAALWLLIAFAVGRGRRKNVCGGTGAGRGGVTGKRRMGGCGAAKKNKTYLGYLAADNVFFVLFDINESYFDFCVSTTVEDS
jgi:hypothetical protein